VRQHLSHELRDKSPILQRTRLRPIRFYAISVYRRSRVEQSDIAVMELRLAFLEKLNSVYLDWLQREYSGPFSLLAEFFPPPRLDQISRSDPSQ
jgi:hypothetical protein